MTEYTQADLEQNRKLNNLVNNIATLTARVAAIEAKLQPWDGIAARLMPALEFIERLRGVHP